MNKILYFSAILLFAVWGCSPKIDYKGYVPENVNNFSTGFITQVLQGNIDSSMELLAPNMKNENGHAVLTNTYQNLQKFPIDTFTIANADKRILMGSEGYTDYSIMYECKSENKFVYFAIGIHDAQNKLTV
ncbi:MAG: hypothetical protein RIS47_456 [Bacteroidota bacterium]